MRQFKIEYRAGDDWYTAVPRILYDGVKNHCHNHEKAWRDGKFRCVELIPMKVEFETVIKITEEPV